MSTAGVDVEGRESLRQRPHWGWWVAILGGMALTGLLALHSGAYGWWRGHVTAFLSQGVIWWIFVVAVGLHVGEAALVWWICRAPALRPHRGFWTWQTLLLGYPSTTIVLRLAQKK